MGGAVYKVEERKSFGVRSCSKSWKYPSSTVKVDGLSLKIARYNISKAALNLFKLKPHKQKDIK